MSKRERDLQGFGLALLNRLGGSRAVDRLGLRKPAERAIYAASKTGFQAAGLAGRQFKTLKKLLKPARLEAAGRRELFNLLPDEEQQMVVEAVRRFAEERLRPAIEDAESHGEVADEVWTQACELGLALMAVPEALGGAGTARSPVTSALVAEALGWGDMGQAAALLAPVGVANLLAGWGSAEQQGRYLAHFAAEDPPDAAIALLESGLLADPASPACRGRKDGERWLVSGEKNLVPLGPFAELVVLSVDLEDVGPRLVLVESNSAGFTAQAQPAMGLRGGSLGRLTLKDVPVAADAILGDEQALIDCIALSRLAWCALAIGGAQAALDYVVPYVNERKAFGEPVSHRQGVAFPVAQMGTEVDAMRLMVWRAAGRAEAGLSYAREAALAHRYCADKAMQIGSDAVQLLGGHGYVKEYPVERWYRDLRAVGAMEGGLLL